MHQEEMGDHLKLMENLHLISYWELIMMAGRLIEDWEWMANHREEMGDHRELMASLLLISYW